MGSSVTLSGSGFTGASSVAFHGTLASSFTVDSDSQLTAIVPQGATSGPISVTTPGGSATSSSSFTVTTTPPPPPPTTTTTTAYYDGGIAESVNSALFYLLNDPMLGSASASVSTSSGAVTASQLYSPYGSVRYASGILPTGYGFTHQRSDATSGLDDYGARWYDPLAGQFTSADTTLAGGLNRYAYVAGNPETRTDPTGHVYAQRTTPYYQNFGAAVYSLIAQDKGKATTGMSTALFIAHYGTDAYRSAEAFATAHGVIIMPNVGEDANTYVRTRSNAYWNSSSAAMLEYIQLRALSHDTVVANTGVRSGDLNLFTSDWQPLLRARGRAGPLGSPLEGDNGSGGGGGGGGSLGAGCGESFTAGTLVATPHGEQPIAALQVGDHVTAYDPATGKRTTQTIERVFINHDTDRLDVTLGYQTPASDGSSSSAVSGHGRQAAQGAASPPSREVIHTTASHPWLTADHGWLRAGQLHDGEAVRLLDGGAATVVGLHIIPGVGAMWDLSLDSVHTFAVGDVQAVVHNCLPTGSDVPDPEPQYNAQGRPIRGRGSPGAWINVEGPDGSVEMYPAGPGVGVHAEDNAQAAVPGGRMSRAMGWRGSMANPVWREIPICEACQAKYPANLFPPGVQAEPGGAWEP